MLIGIFKGLLICNEIDCDVFLLVIKQIWKFLTELYLKSINLFNESQFEWSLFQTHYVHYQSLVSFFIIWYNNWVLLMDYILMAWGRWQFTSIIALKLSIDHDVWRIYYDLAETQRSHHIFEVHLLLKVYHCFNLVVFYLIVNDAVLYVFIFDVKHKATPLTTILRFNQKGTTFMQGASLKTNTVLLGSLSQNTYLFVLP